MRATISEVKTEGDALEFLALPIRLYHNEPHWIRPLDKDIQAVFDPNKNKAFQNGKCTRWIVRDESGLVIGRIAAFVNEKTISKGNDQLTGGVGFFECINDQSVAHLLFRTAQSWLELAGMMAMDGPINFGERDRWWGLLVEGFDRDPNYQTNYHFPYYQTFFESYGFQPYFFQFTFGRPVDGPVSERVTEKSKQVLSDPNYTFKTVHGVSEHDLADLICTVYNQAWAGRDDIPEISHETTHHMINQLKPILDPELMWFGYFKNEPIAFFLCVPEVNQIFKHVNGKVDFIGKVKFLYHKYLGSNHKALGLLFGVIPTFQGKGVDSALIESFRIHHTTRNKKYKEIELNWIADFNGKMIRLCEQIHTTVVKRHVTYRKLFDDTVVFKRFRAAYIREEGQA